MNLVNILGATTRPVYDQETLKKQHQVHHLLLEAQVILSLPGVPEQWRSGIVFHGTLSFRLDHQKVCDTLLL